MELDKSLAKKEAARIRARAYYYANKEKCRAANEEWKKNNPGKMNEYNKVYSKKNRALLYRKNRKWAIENPDRVKELQKRAKNKNPELYKQTVNNWCNENRGKVRQRDAAYKARKKAGTLEIPRLREELELIYSNCPEGYEVDHIIPLVHPDVCGLHVPWNLQYLPKSENRSKGNKCLL